ncbi:hypothetical protein CYLTODRAFT_428642 [Cylindrobasidium torrendii FP15055 ss-10]|uniref:BTB domain-containing protein n=1 Tax=Cylindrobasidium torrendii FP15055 ss-10 TaxID=1314674 RepID=A0A0D7BTV5_9AGAR|nr:hypothetical protein CYLTODRAFT_428642 [Cylindrobasidium torrendii FP15055 ss-10]
MRPSSMLSQQLSRPIQTIPSTSYEEVQISTTFHPNSNLLAEPPDVVLVSSDGVYFHVHSSILDDASSNHFADALSNIDDEVFLPEASNILNIILLAIYNIDTSQYQPSLLILITAVDRMRFYGVTPLRYAAPNQALYVALYSFAPHQPIEVYAVAGRHNLETLAVRTSAHLLAFPLERLTDDLCDRIGAPYLKRLFFLHLDRMEKLREILMHQPGRHPPTSHCPGISAELMRAWGLATSTIVYDAKPGIDIAFGFVEEIPCMVCSESFTTRLAQAAAQWSQVKVH